MRFLMDRNTILAVVLCFILLIGFQIYNKPTQEEDKSKESTVLQQQKENQPQTSAETRVETQKETATIQKVNPGKKSQLLDEKIETHNDYFSATFSKISGGLLSWKLNKYKNERKEPVELIVEASSNKVEEHNLETVIYQ